MLYTYFILLKSYFYFLNYHVEGDLISIKRAIIGLDAKNSKKTEEAWKDLLSASKDISKKWDGESAVEEIRKQREK